MRLRWLGVVFCVVACAPWYSWAASGIRLHVGSVKSVKLGTVTQLVVGNEGVLGASVLDSGEVLLIPKAPGVSDLVAWTEGQREFRYTVTVDGAPMDDRLSLTRAIMDEFNEVKVGESEGKVLLTGYVLEQDRDRFMGALGALPETVSLVKFELDAQRDIIEMDVSILEVNKQYQKNVGIRWQDTMAGPTLGMVWNIHPNDSYNIAVAPEDSTINYDDLLSAVGVSSGSPEFYAGWTSVLGSEIQLLQANGAARSLAEPRLSTISGETASFLAGGEIPVAILNEYGQPVVEFREYGIQLDISPIADRNKQIISKIRAEVSSIDYSVQVNGVPGLLRRMTESSINGRSGDTIVISGLVNTADAKSVDKVPFLGDIPVLGELFKSRDFQQQRTELLIFVTPRIVEANQKLDAALEKNIQQLRSVMDGSADIDKVMAE